MADGTWGRTAAAVAAVAVTIAACGDDGGDSSDPLAGGDAGRGAEAFAASCAQCHGEDLRGTTSGPPLIHEYYVPSHHGDAAFLLAIQRGVQAHHWDFGPMPPVPAATDDAADIVAYVREQQRAAGLIE